MQQEKIVEEQQACRLEVWVFGHQLSEWVECFPVKQLGMLYVFHYIHILPIGYCGVEDLVCNVGNHFRYKLFLHG